MIIQEFSFANYRSFKNIQTLNMASAIIKSKYESIDESRMNYIVNFLKYGDTGIENINTSDVFPVCISKNLESKNSNMPETGKKKKIVISIRKKYNGKKEFHEDETFPFNLLEFVGTLKLFEYSSIIFQVLKKNRPLIIDEFDSRFHPQLTKKNIELFNSEQNSITLAYKTVKLLNKNCHNINPLLSLLN